MATVSRGTGIVRIGLIELIEDRAAPLIVNVTDLSHDLSLLVCHTTYLLVFIRRAFGGVLVFAVVPILVILGRRSKTQIVDGVLLIINNAGLLQHISQIHHAITVICVQSVPTELPELSFCHFTSFLHLLGA